MDGLAYSLFGVPHPGNGIKPATLRSAEYTSTHTTFTLTAGSADFVLDFLSPISPHNYLRQSLPFSYLTVSALGRSDASPSIQIYSDIDNSWAGQFGQYVATDWNWALTQESAHVFTIGVGGGQDFVEVNDRAQWGEAVYCTQPSASTITDFVGDAEVLRAEFATSGTLADSEWAWQAGSVVAHSHDLGKVGSTAKNATFAVGYVREHDVSYLGQKRSGYWRSSIRDAYAGCVYALADFADADAEARSLDSQIAAKAQYAGGSSYRDIVTLSVRQVFGAFDLTIPETGLDTNDLMIFVKEISSNGNVNTVDVILPISPILYVLAPEYIRLLSEPVMRYLNTGRWPQNYTIHDIGSHYPNATGHDDGKAQEMPVEECANILLLAHMYTTGTGDRSWIDQYAALFQQYADYLVANGLYPTPQFSSDDGAGVEGNQTSLAIKAAIALNAYGVLTGQPQYSDIGRDFADTLFVDGAGNDPGRTHFTLTQGDGESWALAYNLFLDLLVKPRTFPDDAYSVSTAYYPSVRGEAAVPLDSRVNWAKTDWMLFAAAIAKRVGNSQVEAMFVEDVHGFLTNGQNDAPFSDNFYAYTNGSKIAGNYNTYRARPVVGGHFALMALDGPGQIQYGSGQVRRSRERSEAWVSRAWMAVKRYFLH